MKITIFFLMLLGGPLLAQEPPSSAENPLAQLRDQVKRVLVEAELPFTEDQEKAITLMLEERRQASEELFGQTMDFSGGPVQGQEIDRALAAIEWIRDEFLKRLADYLTPEQNDVWNRVESSEASEESLAAGAESPRRTSPRQSQTQYVRINNNTFTAEEGNYRFDNFQFGNQRNFQDRNQGNFQGDQRNFRGNDRTEVIQRGGTGAFHGDAQLLFKDESLNARNPFASNKPPYQERQASFDFSGPLIPGRLTASFAANHGESKNVDTIHATLPEGLFELGITKPAVNRSANTRGTYQFTDAHSLTFGLRYFTNSRKNQGVGGFDLPDRASNSTGNSWTVEMRQFSAFSMHSIYETRFIFNRNRFRARAANNQPTVTVLDTFARGSAQNNSENTGSDYEFGNLYTRLGEKLTLKAGIDGMYRRQRSLSEDNFAGAFTFSSLDAYVNGQPATYRVTRGDPLLETKQLELSFLLQNDFKLTPRFTLMLGARYDFQTNLSDHNNVSPRIATAYAIGRATVIRIGGGTFYRRLERNDFETVLRLDGKRQYEIVIDSPSYPDPFQAGSLRNSFPSVRVTDPNLVAPYDAITSGSFERTFSNNLFMSASFELGREVHRFRTRNTNAPLPACTSVFTTKPTDDQIRACRPDPNRGNVLNLQSTGGDMWRRFHLNFRQRFNIFTVTGGYQLQANRNELGGQEIFNLPANNYDLHAEWARSGQLHQFNGTVNAQLPLGVFLTGSVFGNSGRYYTITTGKDDNYDTQINDRPPGLGRNSGIGPGYLTFNFNISKAFFFGSPNANGNGGTRTNVNLFANMTNAFNRLNYGVPSGVMTSTNFGKSTSAQDPREIEVGLRFQF